MDTKVTDLHAVPATSAQAIKDYLAARSFTQSEAELRKVGLEFAGAARLTAELGYTVPRACAGLLFRHPGTNYTTVKIIAGHKDRRGQRCPKGVTPHMFIPPGVKLEGKLYLCESPLKALILWLYFGLNAVAVGGVDCYYMARKKVWCVGFPHSEIESGAITEIVIVFDSNTEKGVNLNVERAVSTLANQLLHEHPRLDGAITKHYLPPPPQDYGKDDWGIDDAYATWGPAKFEEWLTDPEHDTKLKFDELQRHLNELNAQYTVCITPPVVIQNETGGLIKPTDFKSFVEANRIVFKENKSGGTSTIKVAEKFIQQPDRPQVAKIVYAPGQDTRYRGNHNLWEDDGVQAQVGDITPWLEFLENAIPDKASRDQLHASIALKMQNRDTKLMKCLWLFGTQHGEGKSTLAETIGTLVGKLNTSQIDFSALTGNFNSNWAKREVVIIDDAPAIFDKTVAKMRQEITTRTTTLNEKFVPAFDIDDFKLMVITSNEPTSIKINKDERRYACAKFEPRVRRNGDEQYWSEFHQWLDDKGGRGIIRNYYETLDVSDWSMNFMPRNPDVIEETANAGKGGLENALADIHEQYFEEGKPWAEGEEGTRIPMVMTAFAIGQVFGDGTLDPQDVAGKLTAAQFKQYKERGKRVCFGERRTSAWLLHPDAGRLSRKQVAHMLKQLIPIPD